MAIINKPKNKLMKVAAASAKVKKQDGAGRAKAVKPAKKQPQGGAKRTSKGPKTKS